MSSQEISADDSYSRQRDEVLDSEIAYVDTGTGDPVVFLHGNPTSSYLWRNIIPYLEERARCLAPDLIGMGESDGNPSGSYRFVDHAEYLDAWFDELNLDNVVFVVHDWGSALGFNWARRHPERVKGLVYMEAILPPLTWDAFSDDTEDIFRSLRSPQGEEMILEDNFFVETVLPNSILRDLTEKEMETYRKPYRESPESRRPTLTWPREIPIGGEPEDTDEIVREYSNWLEQAEHPKLFINPEPGILCTGEREEFCRSLPNQREVTVEGLHFVQEDSPHQIGQHLVEFYDDLAR